MLFRSLVDDLPGGRSRLTRDPVNVASRMESSGLPDCIQVSERTYELIKTDFICHPRGTIEIKGKGEMRTWLVEGRRKGLGIRG